MNIHLENIMKVADISFDADLADLVKFIKKQAPTYRDQGSHTNEHLYDISAMLENLEEGQIPEDIKHQLGELLDLMNQNDCAYLRIIE